MAVEAKTTTANSNKLVRYLKDVRAEFRKITWASRRDVINTTGIVIGTILLFTALIWLYDSVFGFLAKSILNYLK